MTKHLIATRWEGAGKRGSQGGIRCWMAKQKGQCPQKATKRPLSGAKKKNVPPQRYSFAPPGPFQAPWGNVVPFPPLDARGLPCEAGQSLSVALYDQSQEVALSQDLRQRKSAPKIRPSPHGLCTRKTQKIGYANRTVPSPHGICTTEPPFF